MLIVFFYIFLFLRVNYFVVAHVDYTAVNMPTFQYMFSVYNRDLESVLTKLVSSPNRPLEWLFNFA
jgi:hypothetical protein